MSRISTYWLAPIAFALIFVSYLMVWLPHPTAGLSLIGLEVGEWLQFLPEIRFGQAPVSRNIFYLPPITLGIALALFTAGWPMRWQTLAVRLLACAAALLAIPPIATMLQGPFIEWRLRVGWIGLVALIALIVPLFTRLPKWFVPLLLLCVGLTGAIIPTRAYFAMRPILTNWYGSPVGVGIGVWLNLIGHLLITITAIVQLAQRSAD